MLKFLNIVNLAVVHRLSVEFEEGLNVLTGETGAGKSIIVDALGLLLGGRAGTDLVRTGEQSAFVEGIFELTGNKELSAYRILSDAGIPGDACGGELTIRRELTLGSGRSRTFINDRNVTAATLRNLRPFLAEIYGQGEQFALAESRAHMEMLDAFAGCESLRREASTFYARWRASSEELLFLKRSEAERERTIDFLRFQIAELEKINPRATEDAELLAEKNLLLNSERALDLSTGAYAELYESDESVLSKLASVRRRLQELGSFDARAGDLLEALQSATLNLEEVAEALRRSFGGEANDFSPARLAEIEDRLLELERLKRKYGCDLISLKEVKDSLQNQLQELAGSEEREQEISKELEEAKQAYIAVAGRLSEMRAAAAPQLEKRLKSELQQVALDQARVRISVQTAEIDGTGRSLDEPGSVGVESGAESEVSQAFFTPSGADRVEFLFSANVGESVRALARVASGGELSRLMLALRTACRGTFGRRGESNSSATLVFDEVDAGIGGRAAEAVGSRLKILAEAQQVLCVTHQPQIARFADHHYVVSKRVEGGRTLTSVQKSDGEGRIGELARMIGGQEDVTEARETARWMLESVRRGEGARGVRSRKRTPATHDKKL